ncbi:hypothetical protein CR513_58809, partial [Mucuna pruriens]
MRLVVAIATNANLSMHQLDVKSTFLNGAMEEEVYINRLQEFVVNGEENEQSNPTGAPTEVKRILKKEIGEERIHARVKIVSLVSCKENIETGVETKVIGKALQVSLSSSEAEYIVAFETACQVACLEALMKELQVKNLCKVKLLVNNKSVIDLARHLAAHGRSKHIEIRNGTPRHQTKVQTIQEQNDICRDGSSDMSGVAANYHSRYSFHVAVRTGNLLAGMEHKPSSYPGG